MLVSKSSSNRGSSGSNIICGLASFDFSLLSHTHYSVSSVQCHSDLLVCLNKPLQLDVEVFILILEYVTMLVDCVTLRFQVIVAIQ